MNPLIGLELSESNRVLNNQRALTNGLRRTRHAHFIGSDSIARGRCIYVAFLVVCEPTEAIASFISVLPIHKCMLS